MMERIAHRLLRVSAAGSVLLACTGLAQVPVLPPGTTNKPGFPFVIPGAGAIRAGHPVVADLGLTPGHKSIIFGTSARKLFVVLYDGTVAPGFPVTLPAESTGGVAVGDVDGDGVPDIVVCHGSLFEGGAAPGGVRAYRNNGTLLWARTTGDFDRNGVADPVIDPPAIADVDGDGQVEVAYGASDGWVYLVRGRDGVNKPGWPVDARDTVSCTPALHDIDGDGKLEVIIGSDAHDGTNNSIGGYLWIMRHDGLIFPGFPRPIDQVVWSSPVVGDINGDGKPEIVFGTGTFYPGRSHKVYAIQCDGRDAPGWPAQVDGQVFTSPALADLDADGVLDVVVTDDLSGAPPNNLPHVYGFKGNGTRLFKTIPKAYAGVSFNAGDPLVGDVIGDGKVEIVVPTNTELCVLDRNGNQLTDNGTHPPGSYSFWTENGLAGAVLADFEPATPGMELVVVSSVPDVSPTSSIKVYVWQRQQAGPVPWGALHHDAARLGVAPGTGVCGSTGMGFYTVTPCRIFDTRDPVGPYGGPALAGQVERTWTVTGRCGVPVDARGVSGNLTVVGPTVNGDVRVYAGGDQAPLASSINFAAGQVRANNVVTRLGPTGAISMMNDQPTGTVHLIFDVNGYFR